MRSKFIKRQECLKQIHDIAHYAVNGQTDKLEPLYYDILNPLLALEGLITPWYIKLWEKFYNKYGWKIQCRWNGIDEIPF